MDRERQSVLIKLLESPGKTRELVDSLRRYPWDSDAELATLTSTHIHDALSAYIQGSLTETALEQWANAIECREDIAVQDGRDGAVRVALHKLANPALEGAMTPESARELQRRLAG